uniref:Uncharacterized protein n=1 Tax=Anopheles coluzzii TaxID=1518534 RepID=A0A8W7PDC9_ANOCL
MESSITSGTAKKGPSKSILDKMNLFGANAKGQDKHPPKPNSKSSKTNKGSQPIPNRGPKVNKPQLIAQKQQHDVGLDHKQSDITTITAASNEVITDRQITEPVPEELILDVPDQIAPENMSFETHRNEETEQMDSLEVSEKDSSDTVPIATVQDDSKPIAIQEDLKIMLDSIDECTTCQQPDSFAENPRVHELHETNVPKQVETVLIHPKKNPNVPPDTIDQPASEQRTMKPPTATGPVERKATPISVKPHKEVLQQRSSKSSQSSLLSDGPSSSSQCHLIELSQPKPEALKLTLIRLRQLHGGSEAEKIGSIERHLRGLRDSPRKQSSLKTAKLSEQNAKTRKPNDPIRAKPKQSSSEDDDIDPADDRQAFDKFAANLYAHLERKRALENYEASKLMMPVEIGYYREAYTALVKAFGQPYHKCTLELYQQLAAELGLEAEMFVIDKTPHEANVPA